MPAITSLQGSRQLGAADNIRQNLDQKQAITDFEQLRTLVGRNATSTAQIKLVHTTDPGQLMTFQTKGWLGRKFSANEKLTNTNAAILEIAKKTGVAENGRNFQNLKKYLDDKTANQRAGSARGLHELLGAISQELRQKPAMDATVSVSLNESLKQQGYEFHGLEAERGFVASGGHGVVYAESGDNGKGVIYKEFRELIPGDLLLPKMKVKQDAQGIYQMDRNATELAAVSLRNAKVPHVANPLAYVIKDTLEENFHTVGVDHLKQWASERGSAIDDNRARFVIAGQVLPKAEGISGGKLKGLSGTDKQNIVRQGLEAFKAMAEHGYVHGDIKPDNLMYSTEKQRLKLIDFGGLTKQSKNDVSGKALGNPLSPEFAIPSTHHPDGPNNTGGYGHEADLFAFGLTLLNIFLPGASQVKELRSVSQLTDRAATEELVLKLRQNTALVKPGSPEDLAVKLLELTLAEKTPLTGRLGAGESGLDSIWLQIQSHPIMR
jgi:Protein kinase domain